MASTITISTSQSPVSSVEVVVTTLVDAETVGSIVSASIIVVTDDSL